MTTNTETANRIDKGAESARKLVQALFEMGGAWARYGVNVARLYIETGARSLEATASALNAFAHSLEEFGGERPGSAGAVDVQTH